MRLVVAMAVVCIAACASDKLAQAPPAGVDFSGRWKLNVADSDDPQRLVQAQLNPPAGGQSTSGGGGGGGGGRGGGRQGGGRGGPGGGMGGMGPGGPSGPMMPSVSVMSEGLRWPGKELEIKQVAGVVAFTSDGINRVCQPMNGGKPHRHHTDDRDRDGAAPGRGGTRAQGRDPAPPRCGWAEKTLIVQGGDPDDERPPFEEHYSLSDDGQRLVEVVVFSGGRSSGFTMSRVWDRPAQ
jgi:hypothetical protein